MNQVDANGFTGYDVTGVSRNGLRFRFYNRSLTWAMAQADTMWRGTIWGVLPDGRRRAFKRLPL